MGGDPEIELDPDEAYIVDLVTQVARRDLSEEWGVGRVRDARDGSGLRVDVTFEDRAIALEVTSLQDPVWLAANNEARKLERRMTTFARDGGLGGWVVGVFGNAHLKDLESAITPLMECGTEIRPMTYSSTELSDAERTGGIQQFLSRHRMLHELGLSVLTRRPQSDAVFVMVAGVGFQILGFTDRIEEAVADNASKLREARPRETHLAILVGRWDLSDAHTETAPPALPDDVDVLWIVHPMRSAPEAVVWLARRGDLDWRLVTSIVPRSRT